MQARRSRCPELVTVAGLADPARNGDIIGVSRPRHAADERLRVAARPFKEFAMQRTIVPDIIHNQVLVFAEETTTAREAAQRMADHKVSAVMIVDHGELCGIFTERDLAVKVVAANLDPDRVRLAEVMTRNPDTLRPDDTARSALEKMSRGGYRHLPVLDGSTVVGMVSVRDLYNAALDQAEDDIRELDAFIHGPGYGLTQ
jgi:CBS domain-containing protein